MLRFGMSSRATQASHNRRKVWIKILITFIFSAVLLEVLMQYEAFRENDPNLKASDTTSLFSHDISKERDKIKDVLANNLQILRSKAKSLMSELRGGDTVEKQCGKNYLHIVGQGIGSSTNHIITLAHALAAANWDSSKPTLVIPNYITRTLDQFDLTLLEELYCIRLSDSWTDADRATVVAEVKHDTHIRSIMQTNSWISNRLFHFMYSIYGQSGIVDSKLSDKIKSMPKKKGSTAGPLNEGDLVLTSKDAFLWGGEAYEKIHSARRQREESKARIIDELMGIEGRYHFAHLDWGESYDSLFEVGADHVYRIESNRTFVHQPQFHDSAMETKGREFFTKHMACVMAALWSSPGPILLKHVSTVIPKHTGANVEDLKYSATHRRYFEKSCDWVYMDKPVYSLPLPSETEKHPLCKLTPKFARKVLDISSTDHVFLASDGQQDDSMWLRDRHSTIGWEKHGLLASRTWLDFFLGRKARLVNTVGGFSDALVAALGRGKFFGQPRSTYSFQIYVLRMLLGRESVIIGGDYDIYYRSGAITWITTENFKSLLL